jgi:hypothetical protein
VAVATGNTQNCILLPGAMRGTKKDMLSDHRDPCIGALVSKPIRQNSVS